MTAFQAILGLILLAGALLVSSADIPQPSYARTMLKVARSLPGETEEMQVRTNDGNVATLIVKRRENNGKTSDQPAFQASEEMSAGSGSVEKNSNISSVATTSPETQAQKQRDEVRRSESAQVEQIRTRTSSENSALRAELSEASRTLDNRRHSEAPNKPEVQKLNSFSQANIDYGSWTPLSQNGRALETHEATTEKYYEWKPLPPNPTIASDDRTSFVRFQNPDIRRESLILSRNVQDRETRNLELDGITRARLIGNQPTQYAFFRHQPQTLTRTNIGANLSKNRGGKNVPAEVTVRSEINVKPVAQRTPMSVGADGIPIIHGRRVPDDPLDKIQTWRNARIIDNKLVTGRADTPTSEPSTTFVPSENPAEGQTFDRFFEDINRRYGRNFEDDRNAYFEWDPKTRQNGSPNAEIYENRNDNYRSNLQKRMLHHEGSTIYPNSPMYTPVSQKIAPLALKPGTRTPVLQYAHPELGVQPAKILKSEKKRPENFPENQNSFTEQRHKKKYVLNDKNVVDSYTFKNYYPNQHFYGLKQPNDQPFWMKISENLKNQFSTGVERVSQYTRPVIDPLVEATHKISQNLGLSKGKEAQDKVGTVATGSSILIPALGLVASGAALGIGAVAVGRYLDVDVLKRSQEDGQDDDGELDNQRALGAVYNDPSQFPTGDASDQDSMWRQSSSYDRVSPKNFYGGVDGAASAANDEVRRRGNEDGGFMVLEEVDDGRKMENGRTKPVNEQTGYVETRRRKRSIDYLDVFRAEDMQNVVRTKRLRRTGPDSLTEIVEIDVPAKDNIDITKIFVPTRRGVDNGDEGFYVIDDYVESNSVADNNVDPDEPSANDDLVSMETVARETSRLPNERDARRQRRSVDGDWELDDAFQNLENAEVSETAHIAGDWTNTPCAKRLFCDAMIQRGQDDAIFMEKRMDGLLRLIQPGAALQVSSHFQEVMEAVRRHDCSSFLCPQARPGNVFF